MSVEQRAVATLGSVVVDDSGRLWGDLATEQHKADAEAVLFGNERQHFVTRPRGGSKTTDLAAIMAVALTF